LTGNGNFDDARRSNADANARETRRSERHVFITANDASSVARGVRGAPRGVAQIEWYILWHCETKERRDHVYVSSASSCKSI
jgi:hypothetical protein